MAAEKPAAPVVNLASGDVAQMSKNERIKTASEGLFYVQPAKGDRHPFADELDALDRAESRTLSREAGELSKFFGVYKQQARGERGKKMDDHFFMVRIRAPGGGGFSREQWLALDRAADDYADGTLRVTSRQGIQYHHVYGPKLAPLIRHLNRNYRSGATLGACGDVNRNVMASPIDGLDPQYATGAFDLAFELADELAPQTTAYFQIFQTDEEGRNQRPINAIEPLYGETYLPRKFKIGIAHPTDNSIDVLTQDVGLVPVTENGVIEDGAWDLYSGGGLGLTHNMPQTAALLGLYLGRVRREQIVEAVKSIAILQRENGERKNRRQARWKYTIRRLGVDAVRNALRDRFGIELEEAKPTAIAPMDLHLGWHEQRGGGGYYGISVENGRVLPALRAVIRRAVEELNASVRATAQQDLLLCDVRDRAALERILEQGGVAKPESISIVRRNSMACPAKPTCGLAMTDAENILPAYMGAIEAAGLGKVDVGNRDLRLWEERLRRPGRGVPGGHADRATPLLAASRRADGSRLDRSADGDPRSRAGAARGRVPARIGSRAVALLGRGGRRSLIDSAALVVSFCLGWRRRAEHRGSAEN